MRLQSFLAAFCIRLHAFRVIVILSLMSVTAHAQSIDGRFATQVTGTTLSVTVQLRATPGTSGLGTSTIQFTYNVAALTFESGSYSNYNGTQIDQTPSGHNAIYQSTITQPNADEISLNIDLDACVTSAFVACDPKEGQQLSNSYTDVAVLTFTIVDETAASNLVWDTRALFNGAGQQYTNGVFEDSSPSLPVELIDFRGFVDGDSIMLEWKTASETNNAGFFVQQSRARETLSEGLSDDSPPSWEDIMFIQGQGTTTEENLYTAHLKEANFGVHRLRLRQLDFNGEIAYGPEIELTVALVESLVVGDPYPNPVNDYTFLEFGIPETNEIHITLYDMLGRKVRVLYHANLIGNTLQKIRIRTDDLAGGVYFLSVQSASHVQTRKIIRIK